VSEKTYMELLSDTEMPANRGIPELPSLTLVNICRVADSSAPLWVYAFAYRL